MVLINKASQRRHFGHGAFQVDITYPGSNIPLSNDIGLLNLARVDHAVLKPGAFIGMHPHVNDEIFSYIKKGTMMHKDTFGQTVPIHAQNLMMMNAGKTIYHEESVPINQYNEDVEMLQIFIRPEATNLTPNVQFSSFTQAIDNQWRLLADHIDAPLRVRSEIQIWDIKLNHAEVSLPASIFKNSYYFIYVFKGELQVSNNKNLSTGDSIVTDDAIHWIKTDFYSEIVLFVLNKQARYTLDGMYSGYTR